MSESSPTVTATPTPAPDGGGNWHVRLRSSWQKALAWVEEDQTFKHRTQLYLIFMMVGILIGGLLLAFGAWWWPAIVVFAALVVLTVFYLVTVLFQRWRSAKEWVIQRSVAFVTLLAMIVLAVGFILWLWVNFFWAADDRLISSGQTVLSLAGSNNTVAVSATYPNVALVDAAGNELRLAFSMPEGVELPSMALLATIRPGERLTFPQATGVDERTFVVNVGPHGANTTTIDLVNAQSYDGLRDGDAIEIELSDAAGTKLGQTMTVDVLVEGRRGFALRRFITDTVNDNSPYIFLLLLIAPGLAALTQRTIDQRYAELKARQRDEYGRLAELCQAQFRARNLPGVERVLEDMTRPQYEELRGDTLRLAQDFRRFARLDYDPPAKLPAAQATSTEWDRALAGWPDRQLMAMAGRWREEFVAAWLEAKKSLATYRDGPQQPLSDTGETALRIRLKAFLDEAKDKIGGWDLSALEDRTLVDAFNARVASDQADSMIAGESDFTIHSSSLGIPFQYHDATVEEEKRFLLAGAFDGHHDLWRTKMRRGEHSYFIHGENGCGLTALATWCESGPDVRYDPLLRVRLSGQPNMNEICTTVLEKLFSNVCDGFKYLRTHNLGRHEVLAELLLAHSSYGWLLMRIERAQRRRPEASLPLQQFKRALQTQADRSARLEALRANQSEPIARTYRSVAEAAQELGLSGIVLIYEAEPDNEAWLRRHIGQLEQWHSAHTFFYIFAPQRVYDNLAGLRMSNVTREKLTWNISQLRKMTIWRYGQFLWMSGRAEKDDNRERFNDHLLNRFDDKPEQFERLLEASRRPSKGPENEDYSPRTFMQLWQTAVGTRPLHAKITVEDVDRAINEHRK